MQQNVVVHAMHSTKLWYADGMQNIQEGSVHKMTCHMAVTLAHLAVKLKPGRDNLDIDLQQGIVLASVKAYLAYQMLCNPWQSPTYR